MRRLWTRVFVVALLNVCAVRASAQGIGVRAGVSGSPDQSYAGLHYESAQLVERLRFRPNIEVGVGDNRTLVALNVEVAYTEWRTSSSPTICVNVTGAGWLLTAAPAHPTSSGDGSKRSPCARMAPSFPSNSPSPGFRPKGRRSSRGFCATLPNKGRS